MGLRPIPAGDSPVKAPPGLGADTRLYLSTTAQNYPRVTAWNTSVAVAHDTVRGLLRDCAL
jgi:hypothetical protein